MFHHVIQKSHYLNYLLHSQSTHGEYYYQLIDVDTEAQRGLGLTHILSSLIIKMNSSCPCLRSEIPALYSEVMVFIISMYYFQLCVEHKHEFVRCCEDEIHRTLAVTVKKNAFLQLLGNTYIIQQELTHLSLHIFTNYPSCPRLKQCLLKQKRISVFQGSQSNGEKIINNQKSILQIS